MCEELARHPALRNGTQVRTKSEEIDNLTQTQADRYNGCNSVSQNVILYESYPLSIQRKKLNLPLAIPLNLNEWIVFAIKLEGTYNFFACIILKECGEHYNSRKILIFSHLCTIIVCRIITHDYYLDFLIRSKKYECGDAPNVLWLRKWKVVKIFIVERYTGVHIL